MTLLFYILLKLLYLALLCLGSGLIFWAVLRMDAEEWEPDDRVSEDWLRSKQ